MATISTVTDTTMFQIKRWLGLHEGPEGDTRLRLGEAAELRNWCITKEGSLQIRKGTQMVRKFGTRSGTQWTGTAICGMWYGFLYDRYHFVVASGGKVYDVDCTTVIDTGNIMNEHEGEFPVTEIGSVTLDEHVEFMPFGGILYVMDGHEFQKWDGNAVSLSTVTGYIPLIIIGCAPTTGAGTNLEQMNCLNHKRRVWYTVSAAEAAQSSLTFNMLERPLQSAGATIYRLDTGAAYPASQVTLVTESSRIKGVTLGNGASIPNGPNVICIEYDMTGAEDDMRSEITANRYWEFYNGDNDNRVFLYGDGTNILRYSDLDNNGTPTAEYWPPLNQIAVAESNTPVTGIIRHFTKLLCFKSNGTFSIGFNTMTLEDSSVKAGFFYKPTNRTLGNEAMGQVRLMNNSAITVFNGNVLLWKSSSTDGSLTYDERQAQILSDRVDNSLKAMQLTDAYCYDCNYDTEFYICQNGTVLVYNYGGNVWYKYTNLRVKSIVEIEHVVYMGMEDGSIRRFTRDARGDYDHPKVMEVFDGTNPLSNLPYGGDGEEKWFTRYYDLTEHAMRHCYVQYGLPKSKIDDSLLPANSPIQIDDGIVPIDAFWRSGTLTFDRDWKRKISMVMWVNALPENRAEFTVHHLSDRRTDYPEKIVLFDTYGFGNIDFSNFSFGSLRIAKVHRVKMRVKKYIFYQLLFESCSKETTATILDADIQVRYWANVK